MGAERYDAEYARSLEDPSAFWLAAAGAIDWDVVPQIASIGRPDGMHDWFPDGSLNTCFNAVDRHVVNGRGDHVALIHDSAMTGQVRRFSYRDLLVEVALLAGALRDLGVERGDRVIIYMPMVAEAVFAMLACARLGAVHSVVFGGFAAAELAKRIDDATPKVILSASCGLEPNRIVAYKPLLDEALRLAQHKVLRCLILQRPELAASLAPKQDVDWQIALANAEPADCVSVGATDPLFILYTSGTTGIPKGVVHDNGGHAVALAWSLANVYGIGRDEVFWAASDIGWAVGHAYIVYGPLIYGCTSVMYEGKPVGTPDAGVFWRVIREHNVSVFFTAPTAIRAIKRDDPKGKHVAQDGVGQLRALFLAGERADPDTVEWAHQVLGVPVVDHWWQTELGWPAAATCLGLGDKRTKVGSAGRPVPGYEFEILDDANRPREPGASGDIAIALPLPPGCLPGLWRRQQHFYDAYLSAHPGYYTTGDAGLIDEEGCLHVMSRIDDIINVAGHRLSTGAIEQVIAAHPAVAECAVIGAADAIKGMVPVALMVLKSGQVAAHDAICEDVVQRVRADLGPVASFKDVAIVTSLPKTRSGKILRSAIRRLADGELSDLPPTIEDPAALELARVALKSIGYPKHPG